MVSKYRNVYIPIYVDYVQLYLLFNGGRGLFDIVTEAKEKPIEYFINQHIPKSSFSYS